MNNLKTHLTYIAMSVATFYSKNYVDDTLFMSVYTETHWWEKIMVPLRAKCLERMGCEP